MKNPKKVKTYTLILMLVTLLSCNGFTQETRTPSMVKTFTVDQPGTLDARSSGGGVKVMTHDKNEVIVQLFIRKNGRLLAPSDPEINDVLDNYNLDIEQNGSAITAIIEQKSRFHGWNHSGISLNIIVPREMSCDVSSSGGGVSASGVKGTHSFSSSGGGVHLENITGTTKASSSGGRVTATNQNGDIHMTSSGGGVTLDDAYGDVYARSSGGGVHLNNIHGDVDAGSSGGGVGVTGEAAEVRATSSGGPVRVNISGLSREIYLQSSGGGIDATLKNGDKPGMDLDLSADKVNIELHNFSGKIEKDRVKGTMNGGGIPVYMHSSGGNVNVRFEE